MALSTTGSTGLPSVRGSTKELDALTDLMAEVGRLLAMSLEQRSLASNRIARALEVTQNTTNGLNG